MQNRFINNRNYRIYSYSGKCLGESPFFYYILLFLGEKPLMSLQDHKKCSFLLEILHVELNKDYKL